MAELVRGDTAAFGRHVDKAMGPLLVDASTADLVVSAAKARARVGDQRGAQASLQSWGTRMGDAGLADAVKLLNDVADKIKPPPPPPPPPGSESGEAKEKTKKKKRDDVSYPIMVD